MEVTITTHCPLSAAEIIAAWNAGCEDCGSLAQVLTAFAERLFAAASAVRPKSFICDSNKHLQLPINKGDIENGALQKT